MLSTLANTSRTGARFGFRLVPITFITTPKSLLLSSEPMGDERLRTGKTTLVSQNSTSLSMARPRPLTIPRSKRSMFPKNIDY